MTWRPATSGVSDMLSSMLAEIHDPSEYPTKEQCEAQAAKLAKMVRHVETNVPNRANKLHSYIIQHWPQIKDEPGVWVVGSTAYRFADGKEPDGDLDLVCVNQATVERVTRLLAPSTVPIRTYLDGERLIAKGKQVDVWSLKPGQSIDDMIKGFSDTHPQAKVAYEIATGKLTVYPNALV